MRWFSLCLALLFVFSFTSPARSAGLEEELTKMATENAKGYVGPLSTAFGTAMNSGLYQSAKPHGSFPGVPGFDLMVKFSLVNVPDVGKTYNFLMPVLPVKGMSQFNVPGMSQTLSDTIEFDTNILYPDREVPTLFGSDKPDSLKPDPAGVEAMVESALLNGGFTAADIQLLKNLGKWTPMINDITGQVPTFLPPPGVNLDVLPMVMPQVAVGLPFGSELGLRMIPTIDAGDIGKISFLGLGLKHSISQWIPLFPVDIAGQFYWQKLEVGSVLTSSHIAFNVHASKQFGFKMLNWTPYLGLGLESSSIDIEYTIKASDPTDIMHMFDGRKITFSLPGDNKTRLTVGSRFILALIAIDASYSIGQYNTACLGVGFSFN